MNGIRIISTAATVIMVAGVSHAQHLWIPADVKYGINKQWTVDAGAEYRTTDALKSSDRWSLGGAATYRPFKFLKFDAGYKYIRQHSLSEITRKGNVIPSYWIDKHRVYVSATGRLKLGSFDLSLRESYQFTQRIGKWIPKYASDGITPKDDEWIASKGKHMLRSRVECEYNIRKSRFTPDLSIEMYDNLAERFAIDKIRYTVGCLYKINKHNAVELFYRYIQIPSAEDSAEGGHVIGIGYVFRL